MGKATFSYDTIDEAHEISVNAHIMEVSNMIEAVRNYARHLNKYEERNEIPTDEVADKLFDLTSEWGYIEKMQ